MCNSQVFVADRQRIVRTRVLLAALVTVSAVLSPCDSTWAQSSRSVMSRIRSMMASQRQQAIQALQQEIAQAQKSLVAAEGQLNESSGELQAARSTLQAARERLDAHQKEIQAAGHKQREIEQAIIAAQPSDSEYGKAVARLEQAQVEQDQVLHQVLGIPPHPGPTSEPERNQERAHLSAEQKERLKASSEYAQAMENVQSASRQLAEIRQGLFQKDPGWQAGHAAREALERETKSLETNAKVASTAVASAQKKVQAVTQAVAMARENIATGQAMLLQAGVQPGTGNPAGGNPPGGNAKPTGNK